MDLNVFIPVTDANLFFTSMSYMMPSTEMLLWFSLRLNTFISTEVETLLAADTVITAVPPPNASIFPD